MIIQSLSLAIALLAIAPCLSYPVVAREIFAQSSIPAEPNLVQPPDLGSAGSRRGGGVHFTPPPLPPGIDGPGGSRSGGASRGVCHTVPIPLTALAPVIQQPAPRSAVTYPWGLTTAQRPTLWFYVPYGQSTGLQAEFVVQNQDDEDVYRDKVPLPQSPGVMNVTLPATAAALEVGKSYHWYFNIYCDPEKTAPPIFVDGKIQRITPDSTLAKKLAAAKPQEQVELYASSGLWFNALTMLGKQRLANPQDPILVVDWTSLLQSVGLERVANEPLVK